MFQTQILIIGIQSEKYFISFEPAPRADAGKSEEWHKEKEKKWQFGKKLLQKQRQKKKKIDWI